MMRGAARTAVREPEQDRMRIAADGAKPPVGVDPNCPASQNGRETGKRDRAARTPEPRVPGGDSVCLGRGRAGGCRQSEDRDAAPASSDSVGRAARGHGSVRRHAGGPGSGGQRGTCLAGGGLDALAGATPEAGRPGAPSGRGRSSPGAVCQGPGSPAGQPRRPLQHRHPPGERWRDAGGDRRLDAGTRSRPGRPLRLRAPRARPVGDGPPGGVDRRGGGVPRGTPGGRGTPPAPGHRPAGGRARRGVGAPCGESARRPARLEHRLHVPEGRVPIPRRLARLRAGRRHPGRVARGLAQPEAASHSPAARAGTGHRGRGAGRRRGGGERPCPDTAGASGAPGRRRGERVGPDRRRGAGCAEHPARHREFVGDRRRAGRRHACPAAGGA